MTLHNIDIGEDEIAKICQRFFIKELAVFGSVLRDDFNESSDIDILIEFKIDSGISFFDIIDLQDEFKKLFGRNVDIVSKNAVRRSRNYIRKNAILENHKVIYAT